MSFSLQSDDVFDYIGDNEDIQIEFLCDVCAKTLWPPVNCSTFLGSKKPLLDAQMATPCGHRFCGKCVDHLKGRSRPVPCPLCRQIVPEFCRNIFVTQLLTKVQGDCLACKDKVQLDTAKEHIEKCGEIDVVSLQCNQTVKRRTQRAHESACPMREIICDCGEKCKHADFEKHRA
ncbi:TNF receptor-associated factor 6-B-like [Acropora palmata]|uniref:TNF receptor-associated factor 6-B-like n=1 Tax=Acropora palmata TaxID=6131 RepID=UPI003DA0CD00